MQGLREARLAKGVMAKAVAEHIGVTERTYYTYEKDPGRISVNNARAICEFIGVPLDEIFLSDDVSATHESA